MLAAKYGGQSGVGQGGARAAGQEDRREGGQGDRGKEDRRTGGSKAVQDNRTGEQEETEAVGIWSSNWMLARGLNML